MTGGSLLAALLRQHGIPFVLGMPGETGSMIRDMYEGPGPRHIVVRDERNAPYAAIAYALLTRRVAAVDAGGPGVAAVMMTAGLAEARNMSVPLLALITEVDSRAGVRRDWGAMPQSMDQFAMLKPLLKFAVRVPDAPRLPELLRYALQQATTGRPGPVALFTPSDVLDRPSETVEPDGDRDDAMLGRLRSAPDPADVVRAAAMLRQADRPLILAGGGAILSGAEDAIVRLAERHGIPVATTLTGSGVIDEWHDLAVGVPGGIWGIDSAAEAMARADLIVLAGCKSGMSATNGWRNPGHGQRSIHIDVDAAEIGKVFADSVGLHGDVRLGIEALDAALAGTPPSDRTGWLTEIRWLKGIWQAWVDGEASRPRPAVSCVQVIKQIESVLGMGDVLVCDASASAGWGTYCRMHRGARRIAFRGIAALGSSLGGALGARLARPGATVVQLTGDGGAGYHLGELSTISRLGEKIITVVLDNGRLGAVHLGPFPRQSAEIGAIDFAATARACGWTGITVHEPSHLAGAFAQALAATGPVLLDVHTDPEESPRPLRRVQPIVEAGMRQAQAPG